MNNILPNLFKWKKIKIKEPKMEGTCSFDLGCEYFIHGLDGDFSNLEKRQR